MLLIVARMTQAGEKAVAAERTAQSKARDEDREHARIEREGALYKVRADYELRLENVEATRDAAEERAAAKETWANGLVDKLRDELDDERQVRIAAEAEASSLRDEIERLKHEAQLQDEASRRWAW